MHEQNSSRRSSDIKSIRDYNLRKDARLGLLQHLISENNPNQPANRFESGDRLSGIKQSAPNPIINHPNNVQVKNIVFISAGNANNNKQEQLFEREMDTVYSHKRVDLNDWVIQQQRAWNFGQRSMSYSGGNSVISGSVQSQIYYNSSMNQSLPTQGNSIIPQQPSQPRRIFNPYIVQRNKDEKHRCHCHQLKCSTKQCGCFAKKKRCNNDCQCNAKKCTNHEHQVDSDDDDEMEKESRQDCDDQSDKHTTFKFNNTCVPPDFSPYTNRHC